MSDRGASYGFLPPVALAPGDRFPNFMLPDQSGRAFSFLDRALGNAIVIVADIDDASLVALERANLKSISVDILALVPELPDRAAKRAARLGIGYPLLADAAGQVRDQLRQMFGGGAAVPFAVLLDANQRVVAVKTDPDGAELARWAVGCARQLPQGEPGRYLHGVAPVLLVPDVLRPEDCRALIERWERAGHEEGQVTSIVNGSEAKRLNKAMKSRLDHIITEDALLAELSAVIARRIGPEVNKAFGFTRFQFERFVVTCYDSARNDFFRRHRDNQTPGTASRRFALTLNLNAGEYEGGGLAFPEYGPHRYDPPSGAAILFSCSLLHEALPVTRGRRFTLLNFLRS